MVIESTMPTIYLLRSHSFNNSIITDSMYVECREEGETTEHFLGRCLAFPDRAKKNLQHIWMMLGYPNKENYGVPMNTFIQRM